MLAKRKEGRGPSVAVRLSDLASAPEGVNDEVVSAADCRHELIDQPPHAGSIVHVHVAGVWLERPDIQKHRRGLSCL